MSNLTQDQREQLNKLGEDLHEEARANGYETVHLEWAETVYNILGINPMYLRVQQIMDKYESMLTNCFDPDCVRQLWNNLYDIARNNAEAEDMRGIMAESLHKYPLIMQRFAENACFGEAIHLPNVQDNRAKWLQEMYSDRAGLARAAEEHPTCTYRKLRLNLFDILMEMEHDHFVSLENDDTINMYPCDLEDKWGGNWSEYALTRMEALNSGQVNESTVGALDLSDILTRFDFLTQNQHTSVAWRWMEQFNK